MDDVRIKAGNFTLWLGCDGLSRAGAAKLAFVLQYWALWGKLPRLDEIGSGAILPEDLN